MTFLLIWKLRQKMKLMQSPVTLSHLPFVAWQLYMKRTKRIEFSLYERCFQSDIFSGIHLIMAFLLWNIFLMFHLTEVIFDPWMTLKSHIYFTMRVDWHRNESNISGEPFFLMKFRPLEVEGIWQNKEANDMGTIWSKKWLHCYGFTKWL